MSRVGPPEPRPFGARGKRSIGDVVWVANTGHGPGAHWFARPEPGAADHDHLATAEGAVRYLADHRVDVPSSDPDGPQLRTLRAIREMVRGLVDPSAGWTPSVEKRLETARFAIDTEGALAAVSMGWDGFIDDLLVPLAQLVALRDRLRVCGNPACRLLFVDESRNQTRTWCDNGGCGNRARVRRYRARSVTTTAGDVPPEARARSKVERSRIETA